MMMEESLLLWRKNGKNQRHARSNLLTFFPPCFQWLKNKWTTKQWNENTVTVAGNKIHHFSTNTKKCWKSTTFTMVFPDPRGPIMSTELLSPWIAVLFSSSIKCLKWHKQEKKSQKNWILRTDYEYVQIPFFVFFPFWARELYSK